MYKYLYRRFLDFHPDKLHFACHSHHYWPDVSREAHLQYWDDSARLVDDKWEYIFSQKIPRAQKLICENLNISHSEQIVFAPNTHEFVFRILSSLNWNKKIRILTTDSEFYSFDRQINRLSEMSSFEIVKIPTLPFASFHERFENEMNSGAWDLIFVSHVFFNSGLACDIKRLAQKAPGNSIFVIDGYHSFLAVPLDLSSLQEKVFYLAGSYKYAQGGEGACFLYVPPGTRHRPFYTGWFAELAHLSAVGNQVGYPENALQYAGSTMDFSALYRLIAVLEKFKSEGLTTQKIHKAVQDNQKLFLEKIEEIQHPVFNKKNLLNPEIEGSERGHFLTFECPSVEKTQDLVRKLRAQKVQTDSRSTRLRFGFGLYHDAGDIEDLVSRIAKT